MLPRVDGNVGIPFTPAVACADDGGRIDIYGTKRIIKNRRDVTAGKCGRFS